MTAARMLGIEPTSRAGHPSCAHRRRAAAQPEVAATRDLSGPTSPPLQSISDLIFAAPTSMVQEPHGARQSISLTKHFALVLLQQQQRLRARDQGEPRRANSFKRPPRRTIVCSVDMIEADTVAAPDWAFPRTIVNSDCSSQALNSLQARSGARIRLWLSSTMSAIRRAGFVGQLISKLRLSS